MKPDFSKYSLALVKDGKIIHSSDKPGLRPLVECVNLLKGKVSGCTLHDKVIGLAAARIIVASGVISSIITPTASEPAVRLLSKSHISISADHIIPNILNKDRSDLCPMEKRALSADDNEVFFRDISKLFGY